MPRKKTPAKQAAPPPNPSPTPLRPAAIALACLAAIAFALFRLAPSTPEPPEGPPTASATASASASAIAEAPLVGPTADAPADATESPRDYVGQPRCAECHVEEHRGWERDWHARALSPAKAKYVVGDFKRAHFKGSSSEAWMTTAKASGYQMRTTGADGALADFPVSWVIGGKRMQDTITVFPDGRWQILPVYFHVTGKGEWVDYTETKQGPLGPDHPFFWANFGRNANHECLYCHVTAMDVRYDRKTRAWTTQMVDVGVGCESCHGPGGRHAESQAPEDIVHPVKATPEVGFALCAQCHGPRIPLFPVLDAAHRFIPGQRYGDFFQPQGLVNGSERSGDFFVDGRPKVSSFEVQALMQSRCFQKGKATCLTCHSSPHGKHDADEMRSPTAAALAAAPPGVTRADVSACQGCHQPIFAAGPLHSHHKAKAAQSCVACHMPKVLTGVLDAFADHAIDVPAPENTTRHGIPNACNTCHPKDPPEAMAKAVTSWWPGAAARTARRLRLADAFDDATREQSRPALAAVIADAEEAPLLRETAALLLAQRFPQGAATEITPLLAAADPLARAKAAEALGVANAKDALEALDRLKDDPSLFVRQSAAISLAQIAAPSAEATLRKLTGAKESAGLPAPHRALAFTLRRRGELAEAIREFEIEVDLLPYSVNSLVTLAELYANAGQLDRSRSRLDEALSFNPQHPGARKLLARLNRGAPAAPR
jgi:hypothetical protein